MTYQEFIDGAEAYHELNESFSKGKAYMNYLQSSCMPCFSYVTGTELDPTYSSRRLPAFLLFIQNNITSFCK